MKKFFKENPALVFGLGLPVGLVVLLSVASGLPNMMATPPKYDAVFATNLYESGANGYTITVSEGKFGLTYYGGCGYYNPPQLYRYRAATGSLSRIDFNAPSPAKPCPGGVQPVNPPPPLTVPIPVPDLASLKLDNSNPAPDGYEFTFDSQYHQAGILPELLFFRSGSYSAPVLQKGNYRLRLPLQDGYYNYSNVRFVGWVVSQ